MDKQRLAAETHSSAERERPKLTVRDPYIFEFLGLRPEEVMSESPLEDQLLDKLQAFLIELGRGFCFEARQRCILIGDTYYFVDLVFYLAVVSKSYVSTHRRIRSGQGDFDSFRFDAIHALKRGQTSPPENQNPKTEGFSENLNRDHFRREANLGGWFGCG